MAYVYRHVRLDTNEVFYIGIGSDDGGEYKRAYSKDRTQYWKKEASKSEYKVDIISEEWLTWEEDCEKEKFWITFYGRLDLHTGSLINLTPGGNGNCKPTLEIKKRISNTKKGKKREPFTDEWKKNMSNSHCGKKRKPFTEQHRLNISNAKKVKVKCPHCDMESNISNMTRYHFDNCKNKKIGYEHCILSLKHQIS